MDRRQFIAAGIVAGTAITMDKLSESAIAEEPKEKSEKVVVNNRINQSVCKWCYREPLDKLAAFSSKIGIKAIDLVQPKDWPTLKKYGLACSMSESHSIAKGLNRKENHAQCLAKIRESIEQTADAGFANVITFSGNREGMNDQEGLENCVIALKQVASLAEKKNVTICMELLNSKRDHRDYMCDRSAWGVKLCKLVGSPRVKLLYDIYHMQVQEGDVIATINESKDYIGHYHTAGVPGRNEIDETQELYYPAIMKAIVKTGFKGYVGQEFIPKQNEFESLANAVKICDV